MSTAEAKDELRRRMRSVRATLAPAAHRSCSRRVQERFASLPRFASSRCVALYAPIRGEVATDLLFATARDQGKEVVFPKALDRASARMVFVPVAALEELAPGRFGISEPVDTATTVPSDRIDLMAVPGVAFDGSGYRVGYGGGFFDRLLADRDRRPRWAAGMAFDFQIVEEVPRAPHDQRLDQVVTESRVYSRQES